jgi:hypothetical protein
LNKELKEEKSKNFIENLNKKVNEITKDLTDNLAEIFLKEKQVSSQFINE